MSADPGRWLEMFDEVMSRFGSVEDFWAAILRGEEDDSPGRLAEVVDRFRGMVNQALYLAVYSDEEEVSR